MTWNYTITMIESQRCDEQSRALVRVNCALHCAKIEEDRKKENAVVAI